MMYGRMAAFAGCMCLVMLTTGCATVTGGTTQKVSVKTQKDTVDVTGANCILSNSKGSYTVTTPGAVSVHRAEDDLNVSCTMGGQAPALASVKSSTRGGALAANILLLGVGAVVTHGIDKATGGAYEYPDEIMVPFGSTGQSQNPPGTVKAAVPPAPNAAAEPVITTGIAPAPNN